MATATAQISSPSVVNDLDSQNFHLKCSLYETKRKSMATDHDDLKQMENQTTLRTPSITQKLGRSKYMTQTSVPSTRVPPTTLHSRNSISGDLFQLIRSALKPFKSAATITPTNDVVTTSKQTSKVNLVRYRPLSDNITDPIQQSTRASEDFIKCMGWSLNPHDKENLLKWNIAMKYLLPMTFDVTKAVQFYKLHEILRQKENLDRIALNNPNLIREIESGKYFTLPMKSSQPIFAIFTASVHQISTTMTLQEREHLTMQALITQLDATAESMNVQKNGLQFIYDMQNYTTSNTDHSLTKKVLKLLQGVYPIMLKHVYIVGAPVSFKVPFENVTLYTRDEMLSFLSTQSYTMAEIPANFGGLYDPKVEDGERHRMCQKVLLNPQSTCHKYYSADNFQPMKSTILYVNNDADNINTIKQNSTSNITASNSSPNSSSLVAIVTLRRNQPQQAQTQVSKARKRESSASSCDSEKRRRSNDNQIEKEEQTAQLIQTYSALSSTSRQNGTNRYQNDLNLIDNNQKQNGTMNDVKPDQSKLNTIQELNMKPNDVIKKEFRKLANPSAKNPSAAREVKNIGKNRYRDVIPGDDTRVVLLPDELDKDDFINANYVTGYKQEKAYIFAQGPLESTAKDFWRMIWQQKSGVIAMTTNVKEGGIPKCFQYWPLENRTRQTYGMYAVTNEEGKPGENFNITKLTIRKKNVDQPLTVYHCHFTKWPDHGIPSGTESALQFLKEVRTLHRKTNLKVPIVVHCSAGIGRTGTFCTIDINIRRFRVEKTVDIPSTVINMRNERAGAVQTEDQYLFCYLALTEFTLLDENKLQLLDEEETTINVVPSPSSSKRIIIPSLDTRSTAPVTTMTEGNNRDVVQSRYSKSVLSDTSIPMRFETDASEEDHEAQIKRNKSRTVDLLPKISRSTHNPVEGGYIEPFHFEVDYRYGRTVYQENGIEPLYKQTATQISNQQQTSMSDNIDNVPGKSHNSKRQIKVNKNATLTFDAEQYEFDRENLDYNNDDGKTPKTSRIPKLLVFQTPKTPDTLTKNEKNPLTPRSKVKERTSSPDTATSQTSIYLSKPTNVPVLSTPIFSSTEQEPILSQDDESFLKDYGSTLKGTAPKKQRICRKPRKHDSMKE